jgi:O-antigen/teichoic acid export membrane protein
LIDLGTGINGEILITSNFWRFNFITHVMLVAVSIPMNYFFITKYGIIGSAYSNLIVYSAYNCTRFFFIWKKYRMQPFSVNTLYVVLLGLLCYIIGMQSDVMQNSILNAIIRCMVVLLFFIIPVLAFKLSSDFTLLYNQMLQKFIPHNNSHNDK